jgi:hypothetical protein
MLAGVENLIFSELWPFLNIFYLTLRLPISYIYYNSDVIQNIRT